jgi:hypothetical protein
MLSKVLNDEGSDTTGDDSSNVAGKIIFSSFRFN